ncbi:MAG: EAL domain-containing protein [Actinobacteria bacterium]|uniref:Unannotated protein n=2 Tax=freshwater metagenome TaxID=449393 RepID=A0A6J6X330_9ZZZZ|nr:EAL domain-containing protein [Actinomycetota bacterium]
MSLSLAGTAAWLVVPFYVRPISSQPWPTVAIIGLAVVAMFIKVDVVSAGRHMTSFVMTDAALVLAVLLAKPEAIPLAILATIAFAVVQNRPSMSKVFFNLGQEWLGSALALLLFTAIRDDRLVSVRTGFAALAAGALVGIVSAAAIAIGSRLTGSGSNQASNQSLLIVVAGSFGNAAIALQLVYLARVSLALAVVPLMPLALIYLAMRGIKDQQHSSDRAELLYKATSNLHEQANLDDGLLGALEQVRLAMRAHTARAVLLTPQGSVTCIAGDSPAASLEMKEASPAIDSAARRLASELPGAVLVRSASPMAADGAFSAFATEDAVFAPIRRSGEAAGLVVITAAIGGLCELYQSDVDLVEVLAKQTGLALERGALEQSLSQLIELEQRLTRQAYYDAVTGLANRNFLNEELERLLKEEQRAAILLVDLDDFKTVNDSLGHVAGDELLSIIADRLCECVGALGLVTRVGGDEFAILLTRIPDLDLAIRVASRIIEQVPALASISGREVGVGASIGIRLTEGTPDSPIDVLRDADLALYNAKAQGKGRFACYVPSMHLEVQERLVLTAALTNAVERDEFTLVFQPIYELVTGRLSAVEALVRWRHPERGELLPGSFLSLTEQTGLIVSLGKHVLRQTLAAVRTWSAMLGDSPFYAAVNVSGRQLQEPGFADMVLEEVRESGLPPSRLLLEITESVFIEDTEEIRIALERLAGSGIRLGLDDFGTGYSSLSQLHRFPLSQLKIDRSFVSRLDRNSDDRTLVSAIIQLAEAMRLDVVAEGIETDSQLEMLTGLGCRRGQGWLLGRPQPADSLAALLVAQTKQPRLSAV